MPIYEPLVRIEELTRLAEDPLRTETLVPFQIAVLPENYDRYKEATRTMQPWQRYRHSIMACMVEAGHLTPRWMKTPGCRALWDFPEEFHKEMTTEQADAWLDALAQAIELCQPLERAVKDAVKDTGERVPYGLRPR